MSTDGFSGREAADIVGITYRQLDYWARTDLIRPSLADAKGSGSRRRYSYRDLIELKMIKTLIDAGQRLDRVRKAFDYLRDLGDDLTSVQLVIAGDSVVLVRRGRGPHRRGEQVPGSGGAEPARPRRCGGAGRCGHRRVSSGRRPALARRSRSGDRCPIGSAR
jgi:DNA-binding transcriptional MerR regulator